MSSLRNLEISQEQINKFTASYSGDKKYFLGKVLSSINIESITLNKVLNNLELKAVIIASLSDIQISVNKLTNSLLSDTSLNDIESNSKAENYKLRKVIDERLEEKEKLEKEYKKTSGSIYTLVDK